MDLFQIYIDEDAVHGGLVAALRSRDVTVTTASDAGLMTKSDDEHLTYATEHGCVLYSFNVSDFYRLHTEWINAGREHAGMILAPQQRYSVGEQLRRMLRIRASVGAHSIHNRVAFLGSWGRLRAAAPFLRAPGRAVQWQFCSAFAKARGLQHLIRLDDKGESGATLDRPALHRLRDFIRRPIGCPPV